MVSFATRMKPSATSSTDMRASSVGCSAMSRSKARRLAAASSGSDSDSPNTRGKWAGITRRSATFASVMASTPLARL